MKKLTAERARELLNYDSETGLLTWKIRRGTARPGDVVQCPGKDGYLLLKIDGEMHLAHRVAWLMTHGVWPAGHIDHKSGDPKDNRLCNLRDCTPSQNHGNKKRPRTNTSGYKGVSRHSSGLWRAHLIRKRKTVFYKYFQTKEEAAAAYAAAAKEFFGEFGRAD